MEELTQVGIVLINYAVVMLTKVSQDYMLRESQFYSRADYQKTDNYFQVTLIFIITKVRLIFPFCSV